MRLPVGLVGPLLGLLGLFLQLGCGQVGPEPSTQDPHPHDPAAAGPAASAQPAPTASAPPRRAGVCGVVAEARSFGTADEQAVALHGLWVRCVAAPAPTLCPSSDSSMVFGTLDLGRAASSRAAACGHLTSHGSSFIANPAYQFTYEIRKSTNAAATAAPYEVRLWNASTDLTFALSYRDDTAASPDSSGGTITLTDPAGGSGTLESSGFTTF